MSGGHPILVIIIQRFFHLFKMLKMQHPHRPRTVILIKDSFREPQMIMVNHVFPVNLNHHAAGIQHQLPILLLPQHPGLIHGIGIDNLPDFHTVLTGFMQVTAHHIRPGFHRPAKQLFIHRFRCPVISVHKADPFPLCHTKPQVPGPALLPVFRRLQRPHKPRIFPLIFLQQSIGIIL